MLALLRPASLSLRSRGFTIPVSLPNSDLPVTSSGVVAPPELASDQWFFRRNRASADAFFIRRGLASRVGRDSTGEEDDLEGGLPEECSKELESEVELVYECNREKIKISALFDAIVAAPGYSVHNVLDKWVEEGNGLDRDEIAVAMKKLFKAQMHGRGLQFSKWLEQNKNYEFVEQDYVCRLLVIAKLYGNERARKYIESIPKSFRGEIIFSNLLSIYVRNKNISKAEDLFKEMKTLGLPVTEFACNQLLLLYKRIRKKKMQEVLLLMERENVKPSIFTYSLLIDAKGESNDITGMEAVFESMRTAGIDPKNSTRFLMAKHYTSAGLKEEAKAALKEVEENNELARRSLLRSFAELEDADAVSRIWKLCGSNPSTGECIAAIEAWGKLKNIKAAEAVFIRMLKSVKKTFSVHFLPLLKVYANHKMLTKSKELIKLMEESGCQIGPWTVDLLVKLYIELGEIEKADATLHKAAQHQTWLKPKISSYMAIMEHYSIRGDVHNTEKIFCRIRESDYVFQYPQFQVLLQAYAKAKTPVYGMRDRMKAENFYPNKFLEDQLSQLDAFKEVAT